LRITSPIKNSSNIYNSRFASTIYGILWYIMVYYGILWYIMVYYGIIKYLYINIIVCLVGGRKN